MRDEALEFLYQFAKNGQRTGDDAKRAYGIIAERHQALEKAQSISHYAQGAFIHAIVEGELWKTLEGIEEWWTFGEFCKQKLHMSLSKANRLQKLWERAQWIGLLEEEIQELGWNLAADIAKYCNTRDEVERYLELLEHGKPKQEILQQLRLDKKVPIRRLQMGRIYMNVSETQREFFTETLQVIAGSVKKRLGYNIDPAECIMLALSQWREAYGNGTGPERAYEVQEPSANHSG